MKLRIERTANVGEVPTTKFYINDEPKDIVSVSRALTHTDFETGVGIMRNGLVAFERLSSKIEMEFGNFDFQAASAHAIMEEISTRAEMVNAAFIAKYPAINEVAEKEF